MSEPMSELFDDALRQATADAIGQEERHPLRQALDDAIAEAKANGGGRLTLQDLTVQKRDKDPFRMDTPGNHALAKWLLATVTTLGLRDEEKIHNRGIHYMIVTAPKELQEKVRKPDGNVYASDAASWGLLESAISYARWLGYIPFDQIEDHNSREPAVRIYQPPEPEPYLTVGIDVELPDADDIRPTLGLAGFTGTQPYKLVIAGEKSSLVGPLTPLADEFGADLYVSKGDISSTHIYQMAKIGDADGRPMQVFYFADCDPSGYNMGVVIAWKLLAFKTVHFPELQFQVRRAALTPAQVREHNLPESPLKPEEKRAVRWKERMGVEQTEVDALIRRSTLLQQMGRDAIAPFYDAGLARRVGEARQEWLDRALEVVNANLDQERLGRIRAEAADKLEAMQGQIDAINDQLRIDVDDFDLPDLPDIPAGAAPHGGRRRCSTRHGRSPSRCGGSKSPRLTATGQKSERRELPSPRLLDLRGDHLARGAQRPTRRALVGGVDMSGVDAWLFRHPTVLRLRVETCYTRRRVIAYTDWDLPSWYRSTLVLRYEPGDFSFSRLEES
jgi:hypothetical protein